MGSWRKPLTEYSHSGAALPDSLQVVHYMAGKHPAIICDFGGENFQSIIQTQANSLPV